MASEIRVDKITSLSGVGTITPSPTGIDIAGITTAATLRATTGIVTSLTAGSLTSLGDVDIADTIVHTGDTNTKIRFPSADKVTVETAGVQRVSIGATGYVGIGSDNPRQQLTIQNNTQHCVVRVISAADNESGIDFGDADDGDQGKVRYNNTGSFMRFETGATERLRIASDGDVGIGTVTPQNNARLQVSTSNQVVAAFEGTGGSDPQIYLGDDMTTPVDNCIILGYDKADNRGYLTVGGDGDNVFTVKNGGDIEIGVGNLKIGTSGKGIDFSAAAGSNAGADASILDDYEEGTYTPTVTSSGGGGTHTLNSSVNKLNYVKVGNIVTISGRFLIQSGSGGSGALRFALPFTTSSGNGAQADYAHLMVNTHGVNLHDSTVQLFAESGSGSSFTSLHQVIDNGNWVAFGPGSLQYNNNEYFGIVGSYRAA